MVDAAGARLSQNLGALQGEAASASTAPGPVPRTSPLDREGVLIGCERSTMRWLRTCASAGGRTSRLAANEYATLVGEDPVFLLSSSVLRAWGRGSMLPTNPAETAAIAMHLQPGFDAGSSNGLSLHGLIENIARASEHHSAMHAFQALGGDAATSRH